jgi:hypothetical protein
MWGDTNGGVDWLVAFHVSVFARAVVGFAEGDAWEAVGEAAEIDGVEAAEEGAGPGTSIGRARSGNLFGVGEDGVEAFSPVGNVLVVDRTWLATFDRGGGLLLLLCVHF